MISHINGIGGAFIDSENPERLARWYETHLALTWESHPDGAAFYHVFRYPQAGGLAHTADTVFAIMKAKGQLAQAGRGFTINLRVNDLGSLLHHLEKAGITIAKRQDYDYGRFAWITDPDGNRIELFQELIAQPR